MIHKRNVLYLCHLRRTCRTGGFSRRNMAPLTRRVVQPRQDCIHSDGQMIRRADSRRVEMKKAPLFFDLAGARPPAGSGQRFSRRVNSHWLVRICNPDFE